MTMNKKLLMLLSILLLSTTLAAAQGRQASSDALNKWVKDRTAAGAKGEAKFQVVSAAVSPRSAGGLTVNISVGGSLDLRSLPAVTITVQEVYTGENSVVEKIGESSRIVSPAFERSAADTDLILFSPQFTIADSSRANAVKISVSGMDGDSVQTMLVPIGDQIRTAVLGRLN